MAVIVRDDNPLWVILTVISIVTIVVAIILILILGRMGAGFVVIAIPGFPPESILLGTALGILLIVLKRRRDSPA
ncbi:MAG TPA: hypothetical protein VEI80_04130 [Candidatus Acidoferrales bacterium]|nr:hypothetical protein [Candidatus Acidoferrales bacterium]